MDHGVAIVTNCQSPLNLLGAKLLNLDNFAGAVAADDGVRVVVMQSAIPTFSSRTAT